MHDELRISDDRLTPEQVKLTRIDTQVKSSFHQAKNANVVTLVLIAVPYLHASLLTKGVLGRPKATVQR
jgi:hypothetical protein